jgi:LmbE family N-acetylglucosaminyl deacetylase
LGRGGEEPSGNGRRGMSAPRILLALPHPDDEVVGCAIALRRACAEGARGFALYLTTGVPPAAALWPWQRPRYAMLVARRQAEARATAGVLGIEPLGFAARPSRRLKDHLGEAFAELDAAVTRLAPAELWVSAWEGGHQDHDSANFLASRLAGRVLVREFAEYNYVEGTTRVQRFHDSDGSETVLRLTAEEAALKRRLLAIYRSERGNLAFVGKEIESLRLLPAHDYTAPPHRGTLFRERFHWIPFRHPRVDLEPSAATRAAIASFVARR